MKTLNNFFLFILLSIFLLSCDKKAPLSTSKIEADIKTNYANIVYANYLDAYTTAQTLQSRIKAFTATPTQAGFDAARKAWKAAREPYGQTEAFRFAGGPIDSKDGKPESLINAWPMDEAYVDYVYLKNKGIIANGGIINEPTKHPKITEQLLVGLNEKGSEENVATGYHAIEFLLWGQDLTKPTEKKPGQRPYTDYVTGSGGTAKNQARRATYLNVVATLLVKNLNTLVEAWKPSTAGNYRATFLALTNKKALTNILTGIGILSKTELAGERILTPYESQSQENEHSCFSDNTHRDMFTNMQGIANVYKGTYTKLDGTKISGASINQLITATDPALGAQVLKQLGVAQAAVKSIADPNTPFELMIVSSVNRPKVLNAVTQLRKLGDQFAAVGTKLGLTISTAPPK